MIEIKIKKKIEELLEIDIEKLNNETDIKGLNFNSFALVEFIEWLRDEYKVKISIEQFKNFKKLEELLIYVENNLHKNKKLV